MTKHCECEMESLVGWLIEAVYVSEGEKHIAFDAKKLNLRVRFVYVVVDVTPCDTYTWCEEIVGVSTLIGEVVTSVRSLVGAMTEHKGEYEDMPICEHTLGIELTTQKGTTSVVFRNVSNGHYGGDVRMIFPSGDVGDDLEVFNESTLNEVVVDDWRAGGGTYPTEACKTLLEASESESATIYFGRKKKGDHDGHR